MFADHNGLRGAVGDRQEISFVVLDPASTSNGQSRPAGTGRFALPLSWGRGLFVGHSTLSVQGQRRLARCRVVRVASATRADVPSARPITPALRRQMLFARQGLYLSDDFL